MCDWEDIRVRVRQGAPKPVAVRELSVMRNTVTREVKSDEPPDYVRSVSGLKFGEFEERISSR